MKYSESVRRLREIFGDENGLEIVKVVVSSGNAKVVSLRPRMKKYLNDLLIFAHVHYFHSIEIILVNIEHTRISDCEHCALFQ